MHTRFVDAFEKTLITNDINWQEESKKWVAAAKKNESIFEIYLAGWNDAGERRNKIISKTASIGGPAEILMMLDFCNRHAIEPIIEEFPLSRVNEALAHLESGKARYRIVLRNDFK